MAHPQATSVSCPCGQPQGCPPVYPCPHACLPKLSCAATHIPTDVLEGSPLPLLVHKAPTCDSFFPAVALERSQWQQPVDAGAISSRGKRGAAEEKAKKWVLCG